jgi:hypothetical protein
MSSAFIKRQERRRTQNKEPEMYDITAWSLPLLFNIDTDTCNKTIQVKNHLVTMDTPLLGKVKNPKASVAYLVPWGDLASRQFLTLALKSGLIIKSSDKPFVLEDKTHYPSGTLIIEIHANQKKLKSKKNLASLIQKIAKQSGAHVIGVNSSWVIKGPSFGSQHIATLFSPKIALAWDAPTEPTSAGNTRFIIERRFHYPVTAIRTQQLGKMNLKDYHVLILPSGDYQETFSKKSIQRLKQWIHQGGVLMTLGEATQWAADASFIDLKRELAYQSSPKDAPKNENKKSHILGRLFDKKFDLINAQKNQEVMPDFMSGALVNVEVEQRHWLMAGIHKNIISMISGDAIYVPKKGKSQTLAWFSSNKKLLASGYLWKENKAQLAYKPFLVYQSYGKGSVISLTQDITSRAYLEGLDGLLMNIFFRAPAHARIE